MTPTPNLCARCGGALSQDDEDAAADRGEGLLDQCCMECHCDKMENDLDESSPAPVASPAMPSKEPDQKLLTPEEAAARIIKHYGKSLGVIAY